MMRCTLLQESWSILLRGVHCYKSQLFGDTQNICHPANKTNSKYWEIPAGWSTSSLIHERQSLVYVIEGSIMYSVLDISPHKSLEEVCLETWQAKLWGHLFQFKHQGKFHPGALWLEQWWGTLSCWTSSLFWICLICGISNVLGIYGL